SRRTPCHMLQLAGSEFSFQQFHGHFSGTEPIQLTLLTSIVHHLVFLRLAGIPGRRRPCALLSSGRRSCALCRWTLLLLWRWRLCLLLPTSAKSALVAP